MNPIAMHQYLDHSAQSYPDHVAIAEPDGGNISYRDLDILSDRLRDRLMHLGISPSDRVGIYMRKSIDAVAAIFGILNTGAAYVPVDPGAPVTRNAYILNNCSVKAVVVEKRFEESLREELGRIGETPILFVIAGTGGGLPLDEALQREQEKDPSPYAKTVVPDLDDLAYILYTSGSTGKPKGVMLSHRNGATFVEWCSETFQPNQNDRFSSHAPFHFDLSILDIFLAIKHGGTLVLIGEELGKDPLRLAPLISEKRLSVWYSTPSILSLLAQYGKLERYDYSNLRIVLFAGEVFPVKHLRMLKNLLPKPRYFNLYGPTETNVCTFYEIPDFITEERTQPFPIGKTCSHLHAKVVDEQGYEVTRGQEGELCISGPGVTRGYWNLSERTTQAFLEDGNGRRWYKTGDIVIEKTDRNYIYRGRRDRMVKKRGYRVELGEIETCLYRHPEIKEAAVIALSDEEDGVQIKAFLSCQKRKRLSVIELKRFCAENLPNYMIPDLFSFKDVLPKTSTEKTDYQKLKKMDW
jgi:amino acid adenylation domain-containing protein